MKKSLQQLVRLVLITVIVAVVMLTNLASPVLAQSLPGADIHGRWTIQHREGSGHRETIYYLTEHSDEFITTTDQVESPNFGQIWRIWKSPDGFYTIQSYGSGGYLTNADGIIKLLPWSGEDSQYWTIEETYESDDSSDTSVPPHWIESKVKGPDGTYQLVGGKRYVKLSHIPDTNPTLKWYLEIGYPSQG